MSATFLGLLAVLAAAFCAFLILFLRLLKALAAGRLDDARTRHVAGRTLAGLFVARNLGARPDVAVWHLLLIWTLLGLLPRLFTLVGRLVTPDFVLFSAIGPLWHLYVPLREALALVLLLLVGYALLRRWALKPAHLRLPAGAEWPLYLLAVAVSSDLLHETTRFALLAQDHPEAAMSWLGTQLGQVLVGTELFYSRTLRFLQDASLWTHLLACAAFIGTLPIMRGRHILLAPLSLLRTNYGPGRTSLSRTPAAKPADLSRKSWADLVNCTDCGRCDAACPSTRVEGPLRPLALLETMRREADLQPPHCGSRPASAGLLQAVGFAPLDECTECGACETACPLDIEIIDPLRRLRRARFALSAEMPDGLAAALGRLAESGSPYPTRTPDWTQGLDLVEPTPNGHCDVLFLAGCTVRADDDVARGARATVAALQKAGLAVATLGAAEGCCGAVARQAGDEETFRRLSTALVDQLQATGAPRIVAGCPHCYATLKFDRADITAALELRHATEVLAELVAGGTLQAPAAPQGTLAWHDPCLLARNAGITKAPRTVMAALGQVRTTELPGNHAETHCCGAGGGRQWSREGRHDMARARLTEAAESGVDVLVTGCPHCQQAFLAASRDHEMTPATICHLAELIAAPDPVPAPLPASRSSENEQ